MLCFIICPKLLNLKKSQKNYYQKSEKMWSRLYKTKHLSAISFPIHDKTCSVFSAITTRVQARAFIM